MTQGQLGKFVSFLQKDWQVFGPQKIGDSVLIDRLTKPEKLTMGKQPPLYPFKKFFIPGCEDIFRYQGEHLKEAKSIEKITLVGLNILDLEALLLFDLVFKNDSPYQQRRKNILIVAHNAVPDKKNNFFSKKFNQDSLEKLPYDIFLINSGHKKYRVVAGSLSGKKTLDSFGYKAYTENRSRGPYKNGSQKLAPKEKRIHQAFIKNSYPKIWQELGERCLECGKCTLVCPTCFCFRIDDQPALEKNQGTRERSWDSCFYHDFSEIGGGYKFLKNTAERIHFWYEHKFLRIPREYGMLGCVGCGRCTKACPVDIDIEKNLKEITK